MFDRESGLVKVWVNLINRGTYRMEDVPDVSNLHDMVQAVLYG